VVAGSIPAGSTERIILMPKFSESVVELVRQARFVMPGLTKENPEEKPILKFVSEKPTHDCILHAVRDQRANAFWQAVESMPQEIADTMPLAFVLFTTRNPSGYANNTEGWGGRFPVGMIGVSFAEAEQVFAFARTFAEWEDDYPSIVSRVLAK
jgi:hypothetical protein